jgi:hypothetical protein
MTRLDGNVLAGRLADVLGWDPTASIARCRHCGAQEMIAVVAVYASGMGTVARCPHCDSVLATFVESGDGRAWFGMPGISAVEIAR